MFKCKKNMEVDLLRHSINVSYPNNESIKRNVACNIPYIGLHFFINPFKTCNSYHIFVEPV